MGLRRIAAVLIVAPLMALGCYSPNIGSGRYACGADGGCPDNFHCASNHLCYQGNDSFDMSPVCESDASAPQVCSAVPANGQTCNPGCQTGCGGCGWCAVVDGVTKCLTGKAGTKDVGAMCDPSLESDCGTGLYCQPECGVGRCYKFCDGSDTSVCGTGSSCSVTAIKPGDAGGALSFTLCSLVSTCDAVAQTGCDKPFGCYPTGKSNPASVCECAGSFPTLQVCFFTDECMRGDNCIGFVTTGQSICLQTCVTNTDCNSGTCQNQMPTYGYCM
jgi:hypothetical protein